MPLWEWPSTLALWKRDPSPRPQCDAGRHPSKQVAVQEAMMAENEKQQSTESQERQKESKGTDKYGAGPGSGGPGQTRVRSNTPENRAGEINPYAPTEATEGPSTNLENDMADGVNGLGAAHATRARGVGQGSDESDK